MTTLSTAPAFPRFRRTRWLALCAPMALSACMTTAGVFGPATQTPDAVDARLVADPEVFALDDIAVWNDVASQPGAWIAHPDANVARRVRVTNTETGAMVDAAMFLRDPSTAGPRIIVSQTAARALALTPGHATPITIVAVRFGTPEELAAAAEAAAEAEAAAAETAAAEAAAVETAPIEEEAETEPELATADVAETGPADTSGADASDTDNPLADDPGAEIAPADQIAEPEEPEAGASSSEELASTVPALPASEQDPALAAETEPAPGTGFNDPEAEAEALKQAIEDALASLPDFAADQKANAANEFAPGPGDPHPTPKPQRGAGKGDATWAPAPTDDPADAGAAWPSTLNFGRLPQVQIGEDDTTDETAPAPQGG